MKLAALELAASYGLAAQNLERVSELLAEGPCDLALLPEAALTGYVSPAGDFDLRPFAEPKGGPTASALAALAKKHGTHLVGPLIERDGDRFFNAMLGFDPEGREFLHYRKRHPWYPETWATPGDLGHPVVRVGDVSVTIAVCFDIHFARELPRADLLLFPSSWVEARGSGREPRSSGGRGAEAPHEDKEDSREGLLVSLGMPVVNANWGVGSPRVPGQGGSVILDAGGRPVARARGPGRISARLQL